jgi:hypothetical protein
LAQRFAIGKTQSDITFEAYRVGNSTEQS